MGKNAVYNQLIDYVKGKEREKYLTSNGRDILDFPLHVPCCESILDVLDDCFRKYRDLIAVKEFEIYSSSVSIVSTACSRIIRAIELYHQGDIPGAYKVFAYMMNLYEPLSQYSIAIECGSTEPTLFYRMRVGYDIVPEKEFYHVPFSKRYLCRSERFSIAGYPCLYLGYSKIVCHMEMDKVNCSCIELQLKNDRTLNVLDLTLSNDGKKQMNIVRLWPMITACYIVPFYCTYTGRVSKPDDVNFKEEYIIPQLLTMYAFKNHMELDGIRYYTTKDEKIYASIDDYKNLILFTRHQIKGLDYDLELIDNFDWREGDNYNPKD